MPPNWTFAQALLTSSYTGWGTGSISRDAIELASCVTYFRALGKKRITIMGHSTGSQDVITYLTGPGHEARPPVDGAIIQAPVSDREGMRSFLSDEIYSTTVAMAQKWVADGKGEDILPSNEATSLFGGPVCARRWLSLASPDHDGEDDLFSSDLTSAQLENTFGKLPARTKLCILFMGCDEFVSKDLNKRDLVDRWILHAEKGGGVVDKIHSAIVEGGTHNMTGNDAQVVEGFNGRINGFLKGLDSYAAL